MDDNTIARRLALLSPAKRSLLETKLKENSLETSTAPIIRRRSMGGAVLLSFAQQRLWFLQQLEPDSFAYNQSSAHRLSGPLNIPALSKALDSIVERHEALRTNFVMSDDGVPSQLVGSSRSAELLTVDLSGFSDTAREVELQCAIEASIRRPFDLSRDLMLRAMLLKLDPAHHVLLLMTHHIASDGWSNGILWQELAALYGAYLRGEESPLAELPIQYADYAEWQRQWLRGEVLERQISYWKEQLSGIPMLDLPTDCPRPAVQTYRGARQTFVFPKSLCDQLRVLSRKEGVTLFMVLLAAFQTLLHRYCGQDDIAVGSPIAGRTRSETEGLIGFFVNTLVLRTDLSGNPSFRGVLQRVRHMALGAYEHQDMPFEKLVEELHPDRDLSRSPLFQVLFAFQNVPRQGRELPGLTASPVEIPNETAKFDLSLYMSEEAQGLKARFEYSTDLFNGATIARMQGHFQTLLRDIVANPDRSISDLSVCTDAERRQLLIEWNDTERDYPSDRCVHELFEQQVERSPDAVAVAFEDKWLTYRELNTRADKLAHCLKKLGVGPEKLVGIYVERSLDMVVGLLAILKAGGAYVPLDPAYPKERLAFMLHDAQVQIILTQQSLLTRLPTGDQTRVLCLDKDWTEVAERPYTRPRIVPKPENIAYVIYTSGSTGKPKGVEVSHRAMVNFLNSMQCEPGIASGDTLLAVTTLSFDIAGLELFLPLIAGARVVIVGREIASDGALLAEELAKSGATIMQATPTTWRMLLEAGWRGDSKLKILCGGEALSYEVATQLQARSSSLWNMYGPTETTVWSSIYRFQAAAGQVPIGRPIANTQMYILDCYQQPLPIGVPGELYIGGLGLARGYLNRPELTNDRFLPDPFASGACKRLYKTGDLARWLPDGNIEILRRLDAQVKVRGFRIELEEIESVLSQQVAVRHAVVAVREQDGTKQLVAYIVTKRKVTVGELRSFLTAKLPNYMVPSAFVFLDSLPLTPNGKIDRKALPAPDTCRPELTEGFIPPRTPTEKMIANIWAKVLKIEKIGIHDNFFDLGGHSMLIVRLIGQIETAFGLRLRPAIIFQSPTIAQLASAIQHQSFSRSSLVPIQTRGSREPIFWIHGEISNAFLPRFFGPNQPLYGLDHQSQNGEAARYTRVETIAAHYLKEMQRIQSQGPYYLGGYSFGGVVAFEIAQQLMVQGQEVPLLVLLDPTGLLGIPGWSLAISRNELSYLNRLRNRLVHHFSNLAELGYAEKFIYCRDRAKGIIEGAVQREKARILKKAKKVLYKSLLAFGRPLPPSVRSPYILDVYHKAILKYLPRPYSGHVVFFKSTARGDGFLRLWQQYLLGDVEIYDVAGNHTDLREERWIHSWAERFAASVEVARCRDKSVSEKH